MNFPSPATIVAITTMKAENEKLKAALTAISEQRLSSEQEEVPAGCFIEGYDQCILVAREALKGEHHD